MKRTLIAPLVLSAVLSMASAADKKPPQGQGETDMVAVSATVVPVEKLEQEFGTAFHNSFTVIEVRLTPKGEKPVEVRSDDFILRSQSDGDHSGPLAAAQVVDGAALVVKQTFAPRTNAEQPQLIAGTKVEMKDDLSKGVSGTPEMLAALKKRMLPDGSATEPVTGLLFFPLEKQKPKNLVLSYDAPGGKLRIQFK
jgi:hypothetical protein